MVAKTKTSLFCTGQTITGASTLAFIAIKKLRQWHFYLKICRLAPIFFMYSQMLQNMERQALQNPFFANVWAARRDSNIWLEDAGNVQNTSMHHVGTSSKQSSTLASSKSAGIGKLWQQLHLMYDEKFFKTKDRTTDFKFCNKFNATPLELVHKLNEKAMKILPQILFSCTDEKTFWKIWKVNFGRLFSKVGKWYKFCIRLSSQDMVNLKILCQFRLSARLGESWIRFGEKINCGS